MVTATLCSSNARVPKGFKIALSALITRWGDVPDGESAPQKREASELRFGFSSGMMISKQKFAQNTGG